MKGVWKFWRRTGETKHTRLAYTSNLIQQITDGFKTLPKVKKTPCILLLACVWWAILDAKVSYFKLKRKPFRWLVQQCTLGIRREDSTFFWYGPIWVCTIEHWITWIQTETRFGAIAQIYMGGSQIVWSSRMFKHWPISIICISFPLTINH